MRTGFDALSERDSDSPDSEYAQTLAAMGNHSEPLVKLGTALAYCPFEPEWNLEAAASYLALEDLERAQAFIAVAAESHWGTDETALSSVRLQTLRQNLSLVDVRHFGVGVLDVFDAKPWLLRCSNKNALLLSDAGCFSHYCPRRRFRDHYGAVLIGVNQIVVGCFHAMERD